MKKITSLSLVVQLKLLKCLLKEPTHDDIIEEFYIQLSFVRYKVKLVLRF